MNIELFSLFKKVYSKIGYTRTLNYGPVVWNKNLT